MSQSLLLSLSLHLLLFWAFLLASLALDDFHPRVTKKRERKERWKNKYPMTEARLVFKNKGGVFVMKFLFLSLSLLYSLFSIFFHFWISNAKAGVATSLYLSRAIFHERVHYPHNGTRWITVFPKSMVANFAVGREELRDRRAENERDEKKAKEVLQTEREMGSCGSLL